MPDKLDDGPCFSQMKAYSIQSYGLTETSVTFAAGFMAGVSMAMNHPEWVQALALEVQDDPVWESCRNVNEYMLREGRVIICDSSD